MIASVNFFDQDDTRNSIFTKLREQDLLVLSMVSKALQNVATQDQWWNTKAQYLGIQPIQGRTLMPPVVAECANRCKAAKKIFPFPEDKNVIKQEEMMAQQATKIKNLVGGKSIEKDAYLNAFEADFDSKKIEVEFLQHFLNPAAIFKQLKASIWHQKMLMCFALAMRPSIQTTSKSDWLYTHKIFYELLGCYGVSIFKKTEIAWCTNGSFKAVMALRLKNDSSDTKAPLNTWIEILRLQTTKCVKEAFKGLLRTETSIVFPEYLCILLFKAPQGAIDNLCSDVPTGNFDLLMNPHQRDQFSAIIGSYIISIRSREARSVSDSLKVDRLEGNILYGNFYDAMTCSADDFDRFEAIFGFPEESASFNYSQNSSDDGEP